MNRPGKGGNPLYFTRPEPRLGQLATGGICLFGYTIIAQEGCLLLAEEIGTRS